MSSTPTLDEEPSEDDILLNTEDNFEEDLIEDIDEDALLGPCTSNELHNQSAAANTNDSEEPLDFDESLSDQEENSPHQNGAGTQNDLSLDDDEEEEDTPRDKFQSERNPELRGGGSGKPIPDRLEDVKVAPTATKVQEQRPRRRFNPHQNKVLINPFYRGSVPLDSNLRLRCFPDPQPQPLIQLGAVKVKPPRPVIPLVSVETFLSHPISMFTVPPLFPPPLSLPLPFPPPSVQFPPPQSLLFPVNSLANTITTNSAIGPRLHVPFAPRDESWEKKTEDFLRKASAPPSSGGERRKNGLSPNNSSRYRTDGRAKRHPMPKRRTPDKQKELKEKTQQVESAASLGLDAEYIRKMEEQKRLREQLNKRKELRRQQETKKRQLELSKDPEPPAPKVIKLNPKEEPTPEEKPETEPKPNPERTIVVPPVKGTDKIERTILNRPKAQKPTERTVLTERVTSDQQKEKQHLSINERFSQKSREQKLSASPPKPPAVVGAPPAIEKPNVAAVVRNFGPDAGTGRMRLIAGTVGRVKSCVQPTEDEMIVLFEDPSAAAVFCQRYNGKSLNGTTLSVSLQPYSC